MLRFSLPVLVVLFLTWPLPPCGAETASQTKTKKKEIPQEAMLKFYQMYGRSWNEASLEERVRFMRFYYKWKAEYEEKEKAYQKQREREEQNRLKYEKKQEGIRQKIKQKEARRKQKAEKEARQREKSLKRSQNAQQKLDRIMRALKERHH